MSKVVLCVVVENTKGGVKRADDAQAPAAKLAWAQAGEQGRGLRPRLAWRWPHR